MDAELATSSRPVMTRLLLTPPSLPQSLMTLAPVSSGGFMAADSRQAFPVAKADAVTAPTMRGGAVHATGAVLAATTSTADAHVANWRIGCAPHFQRERSS